MFSSSNMSSSLYMYMQKQKKTLHIEDENMKVKKQEECGNKDGYSNGYTLLIKDLVKKKKKKEEEEEQAVKYNECRKNHAAKIGRYALDGCCEFMAAGEEGTTGALRCAACDCHRNFHRREIIIHLSNSSSSNSI